MVLRTSIFSGLAIAALMTWVLLIATKREFDEIGFFLSTLAFHSSTGILLRVPEAGAGKTSDESG